MKNIPFLKMHGLGNDFVIIDLRPGDIKITDEMVRFICDRHMGVGCDQFVTIEKSKNADCFVRFYNPDASESGACGNASRCIAYLLMKERNSENTTLETRAGILECKKAGELQVSVNMGKARTGWDQIPLAKEVDTLNVAIGSGNLQNATCVNMGNPHAVFFVNDINDITLEVDGKALENHKIFPERANIEIVEVVSKNEINLRVWERGAGETLACGSGACAAVVAGLRKQLTSNNVTVHLKGGDLSINILENGDVIMTGAVASSFTGILSF